MCLIIDALGKILHGLYKLMVIFTMNGVLINSILLSISCPNVSLQTLSYD